MRLTIMDDIAPEANGFSGCRLGFAGVRDVQFEL